MHTLRIGEVARRSGVTPDLLRAWERRYGLLEPERSAGGFRLYSLEDVARVARMRELVAGGLSAGEAARLARATPEPDRVAPHDAIDSLREALDRFDDAGAHAAFDRLLADWSLDAVLDEAVMPLLRELGYRWERGDASVAQEHFASQLLRGRLLGLARGWDRGVGPRAVLACAPGELHDLPLVVFGLALRTHGWRITWIGADTPLETVADAAHTLAPAAVVVSGTTSEPLEACVDRLAVLARSVPLWLAGGGATAELAERAGTRLLGDGPSEAAASLAAAV
jgi:MerR family transcriptional regulator, light-induced transcriptional regulator